MVTVEYVGDDGEAYPYETTDQTWRMSHLRVQFDCPLCGESQTFESQQTDLGSFDTTLCSECAVEYRIAPINTPDETEADLPTEIEYQFESVKVMYPLVTQGHYREMVFLAAAPKLAVVGTLPFVLQAIGTYLLTTAALDAGSVEGIALVGVVAIILTLVFAAYSLLSGPLKWLWDGYAVYQQQDEIDSFTAFIRHAGNFWGADPFGFDDDI